VRLDAEHPELDVRRRRGARLNLSAGHVGELVRELEPRLKGLAVKAIQPFPPRDVLLVFEKDAASADGPRRRVRLSANPDLPRIHLVHGHLKRHDGPVGPFFQTLARELEGAHVRSIEQVRGDRIVLIEFRDAPSDERRALVLELTGRQSNLVLLGPGDRVLELLVPLPKKGGSTPRLSVGSEWVPPGGRAAPRADAAPEETLADLARAADGGDEDSPLSYFVQHSLGEEANERHRERERKTLVTRLSRKLKRARGLVSGLTERATAAAGAERVRQDGELLKGSLGQLKRGLESVELEDYFDPDLSRRTLTLDAKRSPQENVERYFERYRKLLRAREAVAEELARAERKQAALERFLEQARDADSDPLEVERAATEQGLLDARQEADVRKRKAPAARVCYRRFFSEREAEIRVGKTSRDNDELTLRHARGNDLWLHTADSPGSHVILRLERNQTPHDEDVLDAAHLALHFSPLRGTDRAAIHVARRKYVHKPRGAKPGLVTLSGGKTLEIRVDEGRLRRLLDSSRDAPPAS